MHPHGVLLLRRRSAGQQDPAAALHGGHQPPDPARAEALRQQRRDQRAHHRGPGAGVLPDRRGDVRPPPRPDLHRPHPLRREAAQGAGAARPLLRRDQAPRAGLHDRAERGTVEAGHPCQDRAQRGRPRPARARAHLLRHQHLHRSQPDHHGADAEDRPQARHGVPAAREALRRHQRQRQAQQLVTGHQHRREPVRAGRDAL